MLKKKFIFLPLVLALTSTAICQSPVYSFPFFTDRGGFTGTLRDYKNDFLKGDYFNLIKQGKNCCIVITGEGNLKPPNEPPPPPLFDPPFIDPIIPRLPDPPDPGFSVGIGPVIILPPNPSDPPEIGIGLTGIFRFSPTVFSSFKINDNFTKLVNGQFEVLDFLDGERGGIINFSTGEGFFGDKTFSQEEGLHLNGRSFSVNNVQQQQANCSVPEPSTILGSLVALTFGVTLKRKRN